MNHARIKELSTRVFEAVKQNSTTANPEQMIDAFVLEYTKVVVIECSTVVRDSAKNQPEDVTRAMKVASIDVMEHFGL
jgi:Holliday junction resolvase